MKNVKHKITFIRIWRITMEKRRSRKLIFSMFLAAFVITGSCLFSAAVVEAGCWSCPNVGSMSCLNDYPDYINCFPTHCSWEECTWDYCSNPPPVPKYRCTNSGGTHDNCTNVVTYCSDVSSTINSYECLFSCTCNIWDPVSMNCLSHGYWVSSCSFD
jgi:hypothetical protein